MGVDVWVFRVKFQCNAQRNMLHNTELARHVKPNHAEGHLLVEE